ncbi:putative interleukin-17 receptor E-like [Ictalurus punctatus]|uniref:Interleukin-17 receptor E-like n=1 Tax=Ictalurus punctatus TaxID=7998 RepID=W5UF21_ICTPU|nr:putative interleukin-17 receptor E-like [Ictalurus punctatus]
MKSVLLLLLLLLLDFCTSRLQGERVEKIEQCESRCSQGLRCKVKPHLSFERCKKWPGDMTRDVFRNTSISTVMKCEGDRRCSLYLRVSTHLQLKKHIHGIYMCTVSAAMMEHCRIVTFSRTHKDKVMDHQVNIQDDCLEVGIGQDVYITLQTWPQFCDVAYSRAYRVPDCSNKDLQGNIPECTTGKIDYEVDLESKEVHISVSDMLVDRDYHVRLCHKDYICIGTGAHVLLKKENPVKNVTLKYSKPVPCLCIEGWSVMTDASRVQVCPFKNRVEELWSGITFDHVEQKMSWKSSCQVNAVISLCEMQDEDVCQDLANSSQRYVKGMVTYSAVDPHPRLCMKFVTEIGAWIKCPFSDGNFPAWNVDVSTEENQPQLLVTSRVKANLSLSVCSKTGASGCEDTQIILVDVEKFKQVQPNLAMDLCTSSLCIKAKRVDVKYGVTTLYCQSSCSRSSSKPTDSDSKWQLMYVILPAMTLITAVAVAAAVMIIAMIGYQFKRTINARGIARLPGPHTAFFSPLTEEVNSKTELMSTEACDDGNSSENSQLQDSERSNLLNDFTNQLEV